MVYYDQDKLDAALGALAQAAVFEPKDARVHHYLGVTIGKKGWYLGAEDEMRKAIELAAGLRARRTSISRSFTCSARRPRWSSRGGIIKRPRVGSPPDPQVEQQLEK